MRRGAALLVAAALACGPAHPCETSYARRLVRTSQPYAGAWVVARGDSLTLPAPLGDAFRLAALRLDSTRAPVGDACHLTGALVFAAPRRDTLPVTWYGQPERAYVFGWPADLGPFAGLSLTWWGRDSLLGALLFDERLNVRLEPGVTAQFVAGPAPR